jgi:hypothetical protein
MRESKREREKERKIGPPLSTTDFDYSLTEKSGNFSVKSSNTNM